MRILLNIIKLLFRIKAKTIILFFAFVFIGTKLEAQNLKLSSIKAEQKIQRGLYTEGIAIYKNILNKDSLFYDANYGLAGVYLYNLDKYDSASIYIKKCIDYPEKDTNFLNYYEYANCLRLLNRPKEALEYYKYFEKKHVFVKDQSDILLQEELSIYKANCEVTEIKITNSTRKIIVNNVGNRINSKESEYTTVFIKNGSTVIFNARHKDNAKEYKFIDNQYLENIYFFTSDYVDSSFSNNAKTQNNDAHYAIVNSIHNSDSIIVYYKDKLWISSYINNSFTDKIALPENLSNFYYQPTGVFSKNQKTFIFSARKTENDDLDIYTSNKINDSTWTDPIKINTINSKLDEDSPFLANNDTTLYFSSKGFNSSGGYDIYKSNFKNGIWTKPINLNYPINSSRDDIYFAINAKKEAYLSSNRDGGYGLMDIYKIDFPPKPSFNCNAIINTDLTANFDISQSIDTNSVKIIYEWVFDDDEIIYGTIFKKTFPYPGTHSFFLNIIEKKSKKGEYKELQEEVIIDSVNFVGYKYPNRIVHNNIYTFDASISYIENNEIIEYFWKVNDSIIDKQSAILNYKFEKLDTNTVSLQINTRNNNEFASYCYSKAFNVIQQSEIKKTRIDSIYDLILIKEELDKCNYVVDASNYYNQDVTNTDNNIEITESNNTDSINNNLSDISTNKLLSEESISNLLDSSIVSENISSINTDNNIEITESNNNDSLNNNLSEESVSNLLDNNIVSENMSFKPIYFGFDKYNITKESENILSLLFDYLKNNENTRIIIYGHTDAIGSNQYNYKLAKRRINSAKTYLNNHGLNNNRIHRTINLGETKPKQPNKLPNGKDNYLGRKMNRRVEFTIYKKDE